MDDPATRRTVLVVATLGGFLTPFLGSSVHVALPGVQADLRLDAVVLSWVNTSYFIAAAVSLVPFGRLADLIGRKRVYLAGTLLFTAASALAGLSGSAELLIAARVAQGIGAAMTFATSLAMVSSAFPPEERGRALGISVAAIYAGLSVGPFAGGALTQHLGWRAVFLAVVPLGLAVSALVVTRLRGEWADARGARFDLFGAALYVATILAGMAGLSLLPRPAGVAGLAAGLLLGVAFVRRQLHSDSPVLEVRLFLDNRTFSLSNLAALLHYGATAAVTFLVSLHLQQVQGFSASRAGLVLVTQPVVMAVFSPLAGRLSDRIEPRIVASLGMAGSALGLGALCGLSATTPLTVLLPILALLGLGFALFGSPNANAVLSSVDRRFLGQASGVFGTTRLLGQMLSMAVATLVVALRVGRVELGPEHAEAFVRAERTAFLGFAVACVVGIGASLARGRVRAE